MLAPSLHHLPKTVENPEVLARNPHVHQLMNRRPGDILRLRAAILHTLRKHLMSNGFVEVETPMFDLGGWGANARPFETIAQEMANTTLRLRIAPEISLKRLVIAGHERIFELGRVFRNEGKAT